MTSPWPPPAPAPASAQASPAQRWGSALAWVFLLVTTAAALLVSLAQVPWASGELLSGSTTTEFDAGDVVNRADGVLPFAVLASSVGLLAATVFGAAAVPAGRLGRWVVTAVTIVVVGLSIASAVADASDRSPLGELLGIVLIVVGLPVLVLLLLTWRGARRGAAGTAVVFAVLAAIGGLVAVLQLVQGTATVGAGAWATLLLDVVGVAAAVLLVRSVPRRARALQPGDPGWSG